MPVNFLQNLDSLAAAESPFGGHTKAHVARKGPGRPAQEQQSTLERVKNFKVEFGPGRKDILNFTNQLAVMKWIMLDHKDKIIQVQDKIGRVQIHFK
jgi:hypothetical protein